MAHYHRHWQYLVLTVGNRHNTATMGPVPGRWYHRQGNHIFMGMGRWYLLLTLCPQGDGNA